MKSSFPRLRPLASAVSAVALTVALPAWGQTTATTDPVGFITLKVAPAAGAGTFQHSFAGLSLSRPVEYQGTAETAIGTTLTDQQATWTDNQFNPTGATEETATHFIEIIRPAGQSTAVPGEGTTYDIVGTSAANKQITLAQPLGNGIANNAHFRIRKYWTIKDVFGPNNEAGLKAGAQGDADEVLIYNPGGSGFETYYYKQGGIGGDGWRTIGSSAPAADKKIYPEDGVVIRRKSDSPLNIVLTGAVKTGKSSIPVVSGTNVIANLYASSMTLSSSNLYTGDPTTGLRGGAQGEADEVLIYDQATSGHQTFYYKVGGIGGEGWRNAGGGTDAASTPIPAGSSIVIRRKGAAFDWVIPQHPSSL